VYFRKPHKGDGLKLNALVAQCPPLDTNSAYCNFLQCTHFSDTSVVVEQSDQLYGAITGYYQPKAPDTLFVWQVAVAQEARGKGLAKRMLCHLVDAGLGRGLRFIETTITQDNRASWRLFEALAEHYQAPLTANVWLEQAEHFADQHDSEYLVRIGPFNSPQGVSS
jgi:L-2,4-diaminobutyric acid acetyltransferase